MLPLSLTFQTLLHVSIHINNFKFSNWSVRDIDIHKINLAKSSDRLERILGVESNLIKENGIYERKNRSLKTLDRLDL